MTLTAPPAPPAARRRRPWATALAVLLAAVLVPCAAVVLWLWAALSGGVDELLSGTGPQREDARVVEARERGAHRAEAQLADVITVAAATGATTAAARTSGEDCVAGQHNWKVDDGFDLICTAGSGVLLPGDPARFREDALALHAALTAGGWTASVAGVDGTTSGVEAVVVEYWDARAHPDPDDGPGNLPSADYVRGGTRLQVHWTEPGVTAYASFPLYEAVWTSPAGRTAAADDAGSLLDTGGYGTVLVVSEESFRA